MKPSGSAAKFEAENKKHLIPSIFHAMENDARDLQPGELDAFIGRPFPDKVTRGDGEPVQVAQTLYFRTGKGVSQWLKKAP